jgi:voltage-gated potassium channel
LFASAAQNPYDFLAAMPRSRTTQVRVFFGFLGFALQKLAPYLVALAAFGLFATAVLRASDPAAIRTQDWGSDLYAIYTQLFFEPTAELPKFLAGRLIFWITPLVGAALLGGGILRIGSELFAASSRLKLWTEIMTDKLSSHVVVCGIGNVGLRVIEHLHELGAPVVAVELKDSPFVERIRSLNVPVHIGDARRDELLALLGVERARAIVCATNDDLANLEVALDAKRLNPSIRVVMRMFDQNLAGKVGGALALDQSFSTSALSAPLVALSAMHEGIKSAYRLGDQVFVTCEVELKALREPVTVATLEERLKGRIVSVQDAGKYVLARPQTTLASKMRIVLDLEEQHLADSLRTLSALS